MATDAMRSLSRWSSSIIEDLKMRKQLIAAASAALLATVASTSANAYVIVSLQVGGGGAISCNSQTMVGCGPGTGFTVNSLESVSFIGTIGGYSVSQTSTTSNSPGSNFIAQVNNSFNFVSNVSAGTNDLSFTALGFGFTLPSGPMMTLAGSQSSSGNLNQPGQIVGSMMSAGNSPGPTFTAAMSTGCSYTQTTSDSCDAPTVFWTRNAASFSLRDIVTFDLVQGANGFNGSSNVFAQNRVPEPVSTALVGLGLVGMAFFSRRRPSKSA